MLKQRYLWFAWPSAVPKQVSCGSVLANPRALAPALSTQVTMTNNVTASSVCSSWAIIGAPQCCILNYEDSKLDLFPQHILGHLVKIMIILSHIIYNPDYEIIIP